jgi:hypothetical protein
LSLISISTMTFPAVPTMANPAHMDPRWIALHGTAQLAWRAEKCSSTPVSRFLSDFFLACHSSPFPPWQFLQCRPWAIERP